LARSGVSRAPSPREDDAAPTRRIDGAVRGPSLLRLAADRGELKDLFRRHQSQSVDRVIIGGLENA
jgi:hypothetical protein